MKIFIFLSLIFLNSCSGKPINKLSDTVKPSKAQSYLNNLQDSLKSEYTAAPETIKMEILDKYHERLQQYLMSHSIDSIKVHIDEVVIKGRTITTKSHFNSIEFKYGLTFEDNMSPGTDPIYEFMKGLKAGNDTIISFSFTGACQINKPDNINISTFRIFAIPIPLGYKRK